MPAEGLGEEIINREADSDECSCCCGFNNNFNIGGFNCNTNQKLFDISSYSSSSDDIGYDHDHDHEDYSEEEDLFEINLMMNSNSKEPALDVIREEDNWDCESESMFSLDIILHHNLELNDAIYVPVGDHGDPSSMEALSWALKHAVTPNSTTVFLVHVFPQVNLIPSPLGKIPRSHVNPEYVNMYLTQERERRKLLLQKFVDLCADSKVKVEIILIEGDNVAKAIADLVGSLSIRKLVIGTTKSNLRKSGTRRSNGIAEKVLKNIAHESCDVKIICEGREVIDHQMVGSTTSSSCSTDSITSSPTVSLERQESRGFAPLVRFIMPIPIWLFRFRFSSPI